MRIRIRSQMLICANGLENRPLQTYCGAMSVLSDNISAMREWFSNQTEFGERVGVGQSTVVRWEKGAAPRPENLLALAKLADASIEQLITVPLAKIPKRTNGDRLPSESAMIEMVADALQEVPPGTPLSGYPPIVASSILDQLKLYLKHGGFQGGQDEATSLDIGAPPRAPTKPAGPAKSRTP